MEITERKQMFEALVIPVTDEPHKCNSEKCKRCSQQGVTCCEHLPCYLSPDDVKDKTFEGLCALIDTGLVSLDWWEGDPRLTREECENDFEAQGYRGFFLRMRGDNRPIVHPAIGLVECCMLTDDGCSFDYCHRPKGGRELIPGEDVEEFGGCHEGYSKQACAISWMPYHDALQHLYAKFYLEDKEARRQSDADFMASVLTSFMMSM